MATLILLLFIYNFVSVWRDCGVLWNFLFVQFEMYQSAYVLRRLFKKQDETLEGSNSEGNDQTVSTPNTTNDSPVEMQSDMGMPNILVSIASFFILGELIK